MEQHPISKPSIPPNILLALETLPEVRWIHGDDLCDCTFQRIGWWTNPYIGKTLTVRLCCIWAEIYKQYPEFVQEIDAFDYSGEFLIGTANWDGELHDMPRYLWYRQLATRTGKSLEQIRIEYRDKEPPKSLLIPLPESL